MFPLENLRCFLAVPAIAHGEAVQEGDHSGTIHLGEVGKKAADRIGDFA